MNTPPEGWVWLAGNITNRTYAWSICDDLRRRGLKSSIAANPLESTRKRACGIWVKGEHADQARKLLAQSGDVTLLQDDGTIASGA